MIVVSDTSPISNLVQIDQSSLLQRLFGEVIIPPSVERELRVEHTELPAFVQVRTPSSRELVDQWADQLDIGEAEAIALAQELGADRLLIDE
jgi:hypothetical protein